MDRSPDQIDVYVGGQIRDRRLAEGLNQTQLGKAIGVTFQQVQKYEKGTNRVSASMMHRIAATLGCEISDFFPGGPEETRVTQDRTTRLVVEAMANLSADHRKVVLAVAEALPKLD